MDSIFAKLVLSLASILGLVSAPTYIQLNTASIVFDYQTGESRPLYYLNVKNIGPQRERFDVSANVPWIFISREGYDNVTSLHLESESAVNFTLDIRPEMVADGSHSGRITVQAVDVYTYSAIETKTVEVTFNKNFVPTTLPSPSLTPTLSASPIVSSAVSPTLTVTATPTQVSIPVPSADGGATGQASSPQVTPISTVISTPRQVVTSTPVLTKTVEVKPPQEIKTPEASAFPASSPKPTAEVYPSRTKTLLVDLWQFLKNALWPW